MYPAMQLQPALLSQSAGKWPRQPRISPGAHDIPRNKNRSSDPKDVGRRRIYMAGIDISWGAQLYD